MDSSSYRGKSSLILFFTAKKFTIKLKPQHYPVYISRHDSVILPAYKKWGRSNHMLYLSSKKFLKLLLLGNSTFNVLPFSDSVTFHYLELLDFWTLYILSHLVWIFVQLEYAALDAAVLLHIFQHVSNHSLPTDSLDEHSRIEWKSCIVRIPEPMSRSHSLSIFYIT